MGGGNGAAQERRGRKREERLSCQFLGIIWQDLNLEGKVVIMKTTIFNVVELGVISLCTLKYGVIGFGS